MKTEFTSAVRRWYNGLNDQVLRRRLDKALEQLQLASDIRDLRGVVRLRGEPGRAYRIRIGKFRLLFRLRNDTLVIYEIGLRGKVY